jgi:hypothetical protein
MPPDIPEAVQFSGSGRRRDAIASVNILAAEIRDAQDGTDSGQGAGIESRRCRNIIQDAGYGRHDGKYSSIRHRSRRPGMEEAWQEPEAFAGRIEPIGKAGQ